MDNNLFWKQKNNLFQIEEEDDIENSFQVQY